MSSIEVQFAMVGEPRGVAMHAVKGDSVKATEAAIDLVFLKEIVRQANIYNTSFERAWRKGIDPSTHFHDLDVLADIQCALFAAIVISRILKPTVMKKYPQMTKAESQRHADSRAHRLLEHLQLPTDSPILAVSEVRNSYEHIDERIDALSINGAASITDWTISDGTALGTLAEVAGGHHMLRVFYPAGGRLFYDNTSIDMYTLDLHLLTIRAQVAPQVIHDLTNSASQESWRFGSSQAQYLYPPEHVSALAERWQETRHNLGYPVVSETRIHIPGMGTV